MDAKGLIKTLIILIIVQQNNASILRQVKMCLFPDCVNITVSSEETREVFVTRCNINKVTIIGDPSAVKIRDQTRAVCGKSIRLYSDILRKKINILTITEKQTLIKTAKNYF